MLEIGSSVVIEAAMLESFAGVLREQYKLDSSPTMIPREKEGEQKEDKEDKKDKEEQPAPPRWISKLLPNLKAVVIEPDLAAKWVEYSSIPRMVDAAMVPHSLPLVLMNHPTVEHFCQPRLFSNLALHHENFLVSTPPKVFTCHIHFDISESPWHRSSVLADPPKEFRLPIILGTTNRMIFEEPHIPARNGGIDPLSREINMELATGVLWQAIQKSYVLVVDHPSDEARWNEKVYVPKDTKVEIYGFVASFSRSPSSSLSPSPSERSHDLEQPQRSYLSKVQTRLDSILDQKWRGKVVLKNAEEAPPCTACGLDLVEQCRTRREAYEVYEAGHTEESSPLHYK